MNTLLAQRVIIGLVLTQLATIGLLKSRAGGLYVTVGGLTAAVTGRQLAPGYRLPDIPVYSSTGRADSIRRPGRDGVIIFSGCACKLSKIQDMVRPAIGLGDDIVYVFKGNPSNSRRVGQLRPLQGRLVAARADDLAQFVHLDSLPIVVRTDPSGLILSVNEVQ